ncbi:MAG: ATP-dependent RNA helicase [Crocinitomicaceae bacterium]|nr:ATP-dependent RNA helicase [Crocinitomicaceae bacterium]
MKFSELNLKQELLESIDAMRFEEATPIQEKAIPAILSGKDLIACAQTGTGKTAAFIIPVLNKLIGKNDSVTRCLIIVPTRELAIQIDQNLDGLSYFTGITSQAIYGGSQSEDFVAQKKSIQKGVDILIATPGRLKSYLHLNILDLSTIEMLVLDEADRMLDMGFISDIRHIISKCPANRQTLMFSATMAANIRKLSETILNKPEQINLAIAKPSEKINQRAIMVHDKNKDALLLDILEKEKIKNLIAFTSRKDSADELYRKLKNKNYSVKVIHSGRDQTERNETMRLFKAGKLQIVVATDILSRGIDIDELSHVVNYDIPDDPADYVHRIGRTARAGASGAAISFINEKDQYYFYNIEQLIEREVPKENTPEEIGESPVYDPNKPRKKKGNRNKKSGFKGNSKGKFNNRKKGPNPRNTKQPQNQKPAPKKD